ncbi:hypothetical protein [Lysobacter capsici]|uniref:hypothetical protein n=1 Tax=Lysobacter capsici TaxID=435897 RepID=UPI0012FD312C|nr:hypothetical protein [Lysobacter capsici]
MRTKALALRIALLLEEYSQDEINAAIDLLKKQGQSSSLLSFLTPQRKDRVRAGVKKKSFSEQFSSKLLFGLKDSEPHKYEILREFEGMLRSGAVLASFDDMKRFGERVSKDFTPKKSRSESINPLLRVLLDRSSEELEELSRLAKSHEGSPDEDQYSKLASFLIKGRSS